MFYRSEANRKAICSITYDGRRRNFDFDAYVNRHLSLHNQRSLLASRAEDQGLDVHGYSEFDKVGYLLQGIQPGHLEASKNSILADGQGLRVNFDRAVRHIRDYMESTGNANESTGNNHNISAVGTRNNRDDRNRGGDYQSRGSNGGRGGGGERGGNQSRKPKERWDQAKVDAANHIDNRQYSNAEYYALNVHKRQRSFQNKHGRPRNAGPPPPASVSLIELSNTMSTMSDTFAAQTARLETRLTDIDRGRQNGRGTSRHDPATVRMDDNPNQQLTCAGGTPGRNERANNRS